MYPKNPAFRTKLGRGVLKCKATAVDNPAPPIHAPPHGGYSDDLENDGTLFCNLV